MSQLRGVYPLPHRWTRVACIQRRSAVVRPFSLTAESYTDHVAATLFAALRDTVGQRTSEHQRCDVLGCSKGCIDRHSGTARYLPSPNNRRQDVR